MMDELSPLRLWLMRAAFLALTVVLLFFHLLPLDTQPIALFAPELSPPLATIDPAEARLRALLDQGSDRIWIAPDLLIAFALAWSVRRPDYVPALLLAVAFLLTEAGYRGRYRALAAMLPRPDMVRREVRSSFPEIDFDVVLVGPAARSAGN